MRDGLLVPAILLLYFFLLSAYTFLLRGLQLLGQIPAREALNKSSLSALLVKSG